MTDIDVGKLMQAISEDYEAHAKRIRTFIRDLVPAMIGVGRVARAEWGDDLGPLVMWDTVFTLMVDYSRCVLEFSDEDMKVLGEFFQRMTSEYPNAVASKGQWVPLTPFLSLSKAHEYLKRATN